MTINSTSNGTAVPREIRLYPGPAPGSETWNWNEESNSNNSISLRVVYNVTDPKLIVFEPDENAANGCGIIICPGGGFHFLAIDHEGTEIATRLVKLGITVFILQYRLVHITSGNPFDDMLTVPDKDAWDRESDPIIPLAVADGRNAISYLKNNASAMKLDPDRIGIMGFSGGGLVAAATAFGYTPGNRPDFVIPVYADIPETIQSPVLTDAPPAILFCTTDDEFGFPAHHISMYNKWWRAHKSVELHLFAKGSHGFGIGNIMNTTGGWMGLLQRWLEMHKFIP